MESVKVLGWLLEIDRKMTKDAYLQYPAQDCTCGYCNNYRQTVKFLPVELTSLLDGFGLNPVQPIEAIEYTKNPDGTHLYSAMFNIIGCILESPNPSEQLTGNLVLIPLTDNIKIGFKTDVDFPQHFPDNTFQFEFFTNLPWVLTDFDE